MITCCRNLNEPLKSKQALGTAWRTHILSAHCSHTKRRTKTQRGQSVCSALTLAPTPAHHTLSSTAHLVTTGLCCAVLSQLLLHCDTISHRVFQVEWAFDGAQTAAALLLHFFQASSSSSLAGVTLDLSFPDFRSIYPRASVTVVTRYYTVHTCTVHTCCAHTTFPPRPLKRHPPLSRECRITRRILP